MSDTQIDGEELGLLGTGTSCRTSLAACKSRRWSRSPNGWAGAQSVSLTLKPVLLTPAHPTSATATVPGPTRSRNQSTGHVKHSTKLPDEVSPPDWRALSVVLDDRAAIYAEEFSAVLAGVGPAMVEAFTHEEVQGLLFTFAGASLALGRDAKDPSTRFVYLTIGEPVCRFRGIELAPGAIVVDDVARL
jgi:hypothetical protein